jgi:hypothetical protein
MDPLGGIVATDKDAAAAAAAKAESDALRRQLMDKKAQISLLEQHGLKYDEMSLYLTHLIQDFQGSGDLMFVEPEKLQQPFTNPLLAVEIIRRGVNRLIEKHERLAARFELEFARNMFTLTQELHEVDTELAREVGLRNQAEHNRKHAQDIVSCLAQEKQILMQMVTLRRAQVGRHIEADREAEAQAHRNLEALNKEYEDLLQYSHDLDVNAETLTTSQLAKKTQEQRQLDQHKELLKLSEDLELSLKRESHAHNCSLSALFNAKNELKHLMLVIESYHDNLKTQELLDAEHENKKLHAVINNERASLSRSKAIVANKGRESEEAISILTEKIASLNQQIMQTEQKLQTQMMKIPDFAQLRQALDRSLAQSKKYREEILQRKYLLDEIREKNRILDQMEIQESKDRMQQLKALMPMRSEIKEESVIPKWLEERRKEREELDELFDYHHLDDM